MNAGGCMSFFVKSSSSSSNNMNNASSNNMNSVSSNKMDTTHSASKRSSFFNFNKTDGTSQNSSTEKIGSTNPYSKIKNAWAKKKLEAACEKEISWSEGDKADSINIKISALAQKLGISKSVILEYVDKGISDKLKDPNELRKLQELELLSKTYNLPILNLFTERQRGIGNLDKYLLAEIKEIKWFDVKGNTINMNLSDFASKFSTTPAIILKYVKGEMGMTLKDLKELEHLSTTLNLPLSELFLHCDKQQLPKYIHNAAKEAVSRIESEEIKKLPIIEPQQLKALQTFAETYQLPFDIVLNQYANNNFDNYLIADTDPNKISILWGLSKTYKLPFLELVKNNKTDNLDNYLIAAVEVKWSEKEAAISILALAHQLKIPNEVALRFIQSNGINKLKELEQLSIAIEKPLSELLEYSLNGKLNEYFLSIAIERTSIDKEWGEIVNTKSNIFNNLSLSLNLSKPLLLEALKMGRLEKIIDTKNLQIDIKELQKIKDLVLIAKEVKIPLFNLLRHMHELDEYILSFPIKIKWKNELGEEIDTTVKDIAEKLKVGPEFVLEFLKVGKLNKINDLANRFSMTDLPLADLVNHNENDKLDEYLFNVQAEKIAKSDEEWSDIVDEVCEKINANLDRLHAEHNGKLVTQDNSFEFVEFMSAEELKSIKKIIKSAYTIFGRTPLEKDIILLNRIIVKATSEESIQITGLFGKKLGVGAAGYAIHAVDIMEGTLATGNEAVLKKPLYESHEDLALNDMHREYTSIEKIHEDGHVLGIQNKLRVVKDVIGGKQAYSHFGSLYESDLQDVLEPKKNEGGPEPEKRVLDKKEAFSLTYQLLHGVSHMHKKGISHGDIKLGNIFCKFSSVESSDGKEDIGPRLYLADFGGSIDHSKENSLELKTTTTSVYRLQSDDMAIQDAKELNDQALHKKIQEKADVFATCSVICSFFTNELPYNRGTDNDPGDGICIINENLEQDLIAKGLSPETAKLLISGMSLDYNLRPSSEEILKAIEDDMKKAPEMPPGRVDLLLERSMPLHVTIHLP